MNEAILFILSTFIGIYTLLLVLRFYFQFIATPYGHPITSFVYTVTSPLINLARKLIPGLLGYEISSLITAWFLEIILIVSTRFLIGYELSVTVSLVMLAGISVLKTMIFIVLFAVLFQALLSWINPYNPMMDLLQSMTNPFLRRLKSKVPVVGGIDLSPLFLIFFCQLLLIWPIGSIENYLVTNI